ncbi:hypothetical protein [Serratia nevei]|uniref:hypothetical protein n=1 Tax=Serratia nevei TaxID=2703794 RepID=UPI003FA7B25A
MTTIKRFTPDYKMHAVRFEAFAREAEHGELVQFDDHQQVVSAVEAERDALEIRLRNALISEQEAIQRAHAANQTADDLAVENAGFKHALSVILEHVDVTDKGQAGVVAMIANDELFNSETPATDAALAAIEARSITAALDLCSEYLDTDCVMDRIGISYADAELRSSGAMELCNALKSHAKQLREAK